MCQVQDQVISYIFALNPHNCNSGRDYYSHFINEEDRSSERVNSFPRTCSSEMTELAWGKGKDEEGGSEGNVRRL